MQPPPEPESAGLVEVNDICEVDPLLRTDSFVANAAPLSDQTDDSVEIELTGEQMEKMLDGLDPA